MKVYRGAARAARSYLEADRSRADEYYLAEGSGLADLYSATAPGRDDEPGHRSGSGTGSVWWAGSLDGDVYESWVAGTDLADGSLKGRVRHDDQAVRFVEVIVNGPKTWSLAASINPDVYAAYDAAQTRAAEQIIGWIAANATTRIGPRDRQVQVPVEAIEAAVIRHYTSRAGDPHRHLHLQINARVQTVVNGRMVWRGIHTVGIRDSLEAINGIGHAAMATDPEFRATLTAHGYTLDPTGGEIVELQPYAGRFSARARQINAHIDRYETAWRTANPGTEPGPRLRRSWDTRAWADARPDKPTPTHPGELRRAWIEELTTLGFREPAPQQPPPYLAGGPHPTAVARRGRPSPSTPASPHGSPVGARAASPLQSSTGHAAAVTPADIDTPALIDMVLGELATRGSAWNVADIRGRVEKQIAATGIVIDATTRSRVAEQLTDAVTDRCIRLPGLELPDRAGRDQLEGLGVPAHVRSLTTHSVAEVEQRLITAITLRTSNVDTAGDRERSTPRRPRIGEQRVARIVEGHGLDLAQRDVLAGLTSQQPLVVVEGAAGAGKTTTLHAAREVLAADGHRMLVVTPTRKATQVASTQIGATATTAAQFAHWYGRTTDHHLTPRAFREETSRGRASSSQYAAQLRPGDLLVIDEAGMLDQDTADALFDIAQATQARVALIGDRHQLPAVGRGGVLDHAATLAPPEQYYELDTIHRFTDPDYATLTLQMRTGHNPAEVFDQLVTRGDIRLHASDLERRHHLAHLAQVAASSGQPAPLLIADTREEAAALNTTVRDLRRTSEIRQVDDSAVVTLAGDEISVGDRVATRRNNRSNDLDNAVANRDTWTVTDINPTTRSGRPTGGIRVTGARGDRLLDRDYVHHHVELAYATTVYGAQGDTVDHAHLALSDKTGGVCCTIR